uniref:Uncharacterized protein n=1 Tax=Peronospora matthiolae TaxID=2874970 RepID=A0AAV1VFH4_9STRA
MIVEGKQKIPGLKVVVKQQLNGHGPHANHRDPRNGRWSDLGSYPSGGRQIVGNPPISWGLWAIRLGLDGAETQADRGPLGCVLRDRAIRATGRDPETETWWILLKRSARWVDASERP